MKTKLLLLVFLSILLIGCDKNENLSKSSNNTTSSVLLNRSIWPTTIFLGNDTIYGRRDSVCLTEYSAYLSTCGVVPSEEAPTMGVTLYVTSSPAWVDIGWTTYNFKTVPTLKNLEPGDYQIVGCAYMYGWRPCDSTFQDVAVYDTINIKILKARKGKPIR